MIWLELASRSVAAACAVSGPEVVTGVGRSKNRKSQLDTQGIVVRSCRMISATWAF